MNDRPTAHELVEAVRLFLEKELLPGLTDARLRFQTLVAANVLAVAGREMAGEEALLHEEWRLLAPLVADPSPPAPLPEAERGEKGGPSPPAPLPETERGEEQARRASEGSGGSCLPPPLRFGEGAGGRGSSGAGARGSSTPLADLRRAIEDMNARLCALIREGTFDDAPRWRELAEVQRRLVLRKLEVANPRHAAGR